MENKAGGIVRSKKALPALLLAAAVLIAGGVVLGMNWDRWFGGGQTETAEGFTPELDPDAQDWDGGALTDATAGEESVSTGIQIPGYPSITIPAGEETVSVALLNPEGNPCYFTFTLVLKDTQEVLYTSGMVAPGQAITSITMSRALEAGEYDAVIQITTASLEDGSAMNGANVETTLIVQ
ncbi:MAG: hypothetical protein LIO42_01630 [Oscillospiraceae bacterium]|nr:hypothetical protein [Oscillospiraceae bacterium]